MSSYKQYMDMTAHEVSKMTEKEMRAAVRSMQKVVGARMSRLSELDHRSPAARWMRKHGGISTAGKDLNQLRAEFRAARNFLNAKTSTVRGFKQMASEFTKALNKAGVPVNKGQAMEIFDAIDTLKERDPKAKGQDMKYNLAKAMSKIKDQDFTKDDYVALFQDKVTKIYEDAKARELGFNDGTVSGYFEPF